MYKKKKIDKNKNMYYYWNYMQIFDWSKKKKPMKRNKASLKRAYERNRKEKNNPKEQFAAQLRQNTPNSELWFQELFKPFRDGFDLYNRVLFGFIPDVINEKYKYIIEIDGSVHNKAEVKERDKIKNEAFKSRGYKVFRIKAYDLDQFNKVMVNIRELRDKYNNKKQNKKKGNFNK